MSDDAQTLNEQEPSGQTDSPQEDVSTSETSPQAAQSSLEQQLAETRTRLQQLENTNKGNYTEWLRAKQENDALRAQMGQIQYQQQQLSQQVQRPSAPTDEDMAREEQNALIEGNLTKLSEIRRSQRQRAKDEVMQEFSQQLVQASQQSSRYQAVNTILANMGIKDQNDPRIQQIRAKSEEIARNPIYAAIVQNDPNILFTLAAKEVELESKLTAQATTEKARQISVDNAVSETTQGGGKPGSTKPPEKMYFTPDEQRAINIIERGSKVSRAEAERRYWSNLRLTKPDEVDRRLKERRA